MSWTLNSAVRKVDTLHSVLEDGRPNQTVMPDTHTARLQEKNALCIEGLAKTYELKQSNFLVIFYVRVVLCFLSLLLCAISLAFHCRLPPPHWGWLFASRALVLGSS